MDPASPNSEKINESIEKFIAVMRENPTVDRRPSVDDVKALREHIQAHDKDGSLRSRLAQPLLTPCYGKQEDLPSQLERLANTAWFFRKMRFLDGAEAASLMAAICDVNRRDPNSYPLSADVLAYTKRVSQPYEELYSAMSTPELLRHMKENCERQLNLPSFIRDICAKILNDRLAQIMNDVDQVDAKEIGELLSMLSDFARMNYAYDDAGFFDGVQCWLLEQAFTTVVTRASTIPGLINSGFEALRNYDWEGAGRESNELRVEALIALIEGVKARGDQLNVKDTVSFLKQFGRINLKADREYGLSVMKMVEPMEVLVTRAAELVDEIEASQIAVALRAIGRFSLIDTATSSAMMVLVPRAIALADQMDDREIMNVLESLLGYYWEKDSKDSLVSALVSRLIALGAQMDAGKFISILEDIASLEKWNSNERKRLVTGLVWALRNRAPSMSVQDIIDILDRIPAFQLEPKEYDDLITSLTVSLSSRADEINSEQISDALRLIGERCSQDHVSEHVMTILAWRAIALVCHMSAGKVVKALGGIRDLGLKNEVMNGAVTAFAQRLSILAKDMQPYDVFWGLADMGKFGLKNPSTIAAMTALAGRIHILPLAKNGHVVSSALLGLGKFGVHNAVVSEAVKLLAPIAAKRTDTAKAISKSLCGIGLANIHDEATDDAMKVLASRGACVAGKMNAKQLSAALLGLGHYGLHNEAIDDAMRVFSAYAAAKAHEMDLDRLTAAIHGLGYYRLHDETTDSAMTVFATLAAAKAGQMNADQLVHALFGIGCFRLRNDVTRGAMMTLAEQLPRVLPEMSLWILGPVIYGIASFEAGDRRMLGLFEQLSERLNELQVASSGSHEQRRFEVARKNLEKYFRGASTKRDRIPSDAKEEKHQRKD